MGGSLPRRWMAFVQLRDLWRNRCPLGLVATGWGGGVFRCATARTGLILSLVVKAQIGFAKTGWGKARERRVRLGQPLWDPLRGSDAGLPCIPSLSLIPTSSVERLAIGRLCAAHGTVLLYGSYARGDNKANSDIDLLVIEQVQRVTIELPPRLSVSFYTPEHFRAMARRGSLFVLHLSEEARILVDRRTVMPSLLHAWVPPDYSRLREGMDAAAAVLDPTRESIAPTLLRRVALFILRSLLYAECAQRGKPSFAMSAVAHVLGDSRISLLFDEIGVAPDTHILERSRELIGHYLGKAIKNPFGGLEALAVACCRRYPMASHLAVQLLTGGQGIGYTSAPADWTSA